MRTGRAGLTAGKGGLRVGVGVRVAWVVVRAGLNAMWGGGGRG
jgi:hypothetical protein